MKKILAVALALGAIALGAGHAEAVTNVNGYLINSLGLAPNTTYTFDLIDYSRASLVVSYAGGVYNSFGFTEGTKSTAAIALASNATFYMSNSTASVQINVASNAVNVASLSNANFTINGHPFTAGLDWNWAATGALTATNIATALSAYPGLIATTSSTVVYASATVYGKNPNTWVVTSSTPAALAVSSSTFIGGRDPATITIGTNTFTTGIDFDIGTTTTTTAINIANAITLRMPGVVIASAAPSGSDHSGIVIATSAAPGVNAYALSTSSPNSPSYARPFVPSGSVFVGGIASEVQSGTDTIIKSSHTLVTGLAVVVSPINLITLNGLVSSTTYYAIVPAASSGSFKLSLTSTGAVAGVAVDISTTAQTAGGTGGYYSVIPASYTWDAAGGALNAGTGFYLRASNDNVNYWTLPSISSATIPTTTASNIGYDLGNFNYRYLRLIVTGPVRGALIFNAAIMGRKDD